MTESLKEELIRLNPKWTWNWRKTKKFIKKRASRLIPDVSYALGCRGHPGLVIERNYWSEWTVQQMMGADVVLKSLVDGVEESCSIYNCVPEPISKEEAFRRTEEIKTTNAWDLSVKYSGYSVDELQTMLQRWVDQGALYYVLHDQEGKVVRSINAMTKEDAEADIARSLLLEKEGYIKDAGNPRMVEMLTYPVPITSFEVTLP